MRQTTVEDNIQDYSIRSINNFNGLEEIRSFWEEKQWHPYTDILYYLTLSHTHEGFIRPHVMLLSRRKHPETLVVGWIQEKRLNLKIGYKTVLNPKAKCLYIEYAGVFGDISPSNCAALIQEIQNCLKRGEADFAYFKFIRHDSPLFKAATEKPGVLCRDHFPYINPHWVLSLPDSFAEFYRSLSRSRRKKIRQFNNRIEKNFGDRVSVKCYRFESDVDRAMTDAEAIASKTYQRGLGVGFFSSPRTRNEWLFAAQKGWLHVYVLYLNETPCAFYTGLKYGNMYWLEATGFDQKYQYYSPGSFLLTCIIKDMCSDKEVEIIDFGFGEADYKKLYCNQKWNDAGSYIFASTFNGMRLNALRSLVAIFSQTAQKLLDRLNMVGWVKKKWRQQATPT